MLNLRQGFPTEGDILLCTVTKIHFHSVFVNLDEFERKQGLIHISEVSPGRIRNLNDFVQEGKKVVCKVISIRRDRGHIDLSLRRVSNVQRRNKIEEVKQEQKAEKILEFVAKLNKIELKDLNRKLAPTLIKEYGSLNAAFEAISFGGATLDSFDIDATLAKSLTEVVKQRVKPPIVQITGEIQLSTFAPNGVDVVKSVLQHVIDAFPTDSKILCTGGGKFSLTVTKNEYKEAEAELLNVTDLLESQAKEKECVYAFKRLDSRKIKD